MKKIRILLPVVSSLFVPGFAFAVNDLFELMGAFTALLSIFATIAAFFAVIMFFWGLALFIFNTKDDKKREEGKKWMFWSLVILFFALTVWGVLGFLTATFQTTPVPLPPLGSV